MAFELFGYFTLRVWRSLNESGGTVKRMGSGQEVSAVQSNGGVSGGLRRFNNPLEHYAGQAASPIFWANIHPLDLSNSIADSLQSSDPSDISIVHGKE
jgi:hypothetical protein